MTYKKFLYLLQIVCTLMSILGLTKSIIYILKGNVLAYPCITPDGENAYCTSIFSCPHLLKTISSLAPSAIEYVKKSICLDCKPSDIMVCCGSPPRKQTPISASIPITTTAAKYSSDFYFRGDLAVRYNEAIHQRLLPDERYCGFQHTDDRLDKRTDDRLGERPTTALDEFPWLVHISHSSIEEEGILTEKCSGVLINDRYVLTDSYCGLGGLNVKLGEYHTNETVSCDSSSKIGECNEPVVRIKIEEIIRDGKKSNGPYDFVLLRLAQTVEYSGDFISYLKP
ncbi:hypothetical protein RI129_008278 [Pyrocoelia pectoralis]|uniref:Clip domain-containing protein n=1 Tax=Pyrocoelia pectoralis TaxID=417401 RepID=A0AAN7ZK79_9COLE